MIKVGCVLPRLEIFHLESKVQEAWDFKYGM
jgi:hypothetical protein